MREPVCSCPHLTIDGRVIRHLDQMCEVHSPKHREPPHCPTCGCGMGASDAAMQAAIDEKRRKQLTERSAENQS